jgi:hypothetical protein
MPSELLDRKVREAKEKLQTEGYNVITPQGKCPDLICTKDGKILAVQVVAKYKVGRGKYIMSESQTLSSISSEFSMYDGVLVFSFLRRRPRLFQFHSSIKQGMARQSS